MDKGNLRVVRPVNWELEGTYPGGNHCFRKHLRRFYAERSDARKFTEQSLHSTTIGGK